MNFRLVLSILLAASTATAVSQQAFLGTWKSKLTMGNASLNLALNFKYDTYNNIICTLDSPDQGAKDIPSDVRFPQPDSVCINLPLLNASFNGKLTGDQLKTTFTQGTFSTELTFTPGQVEYVRPQTPSAPFPYKTEEVTFSHDKATLSGTLTYPTKYKKGKTPVVLMVSGSGLQNRDEEIMGHKPFLVIADYLARNGIATLRYDDRGFGKSTGDPSKATTADFYEDAAAGIRFLQDKKSFKSIGLLGHSEGGQIAFLAASRLPETVSFIISMAGPAIPGNEILIKQNHQLLSGQGLPVNLVDEYCTVLRKVFECKMTKGLPASVATAQGYIAINSSHLPEAAKENLRTVLSTDDPWIDHFITYDPTSDIRNIQCPVMAVNGSLDSQVDAESNLEALRKNLPDNKLHLTQEYEGLNHLFQHCTTGSVSEYSTIEETISPEVLSDIAEWINKLQ